MWQRFTERARKVVFYAQEEAQNFGEGNVSTEHLLLGLVHEPENTAGRVLNHLGVSPSLVKAEVRKQLPKGDMKVADMTLTPRAKRVIDLAYDEARSLSNNYIGTEHLLLGLIREGDGLAGRVLEKLKVTLDAARLATLELQVDPGDRPEGFLDRMKQRLGLTHPGLPPSPRTLDIKVRCDLQLLHPVDQMLLSLLSDRESPLGDKLRQNCSSLDWLLPSIVATMSKTQMEGRMGLANLVLEAHGFAEEESRSQVTAEDLYRACVRWTTDDVRAILTGLEIDLSAAKPEEPEE